jgi:four helix bundle protein
VNDKQKARNFRQYKVWQDAIDYATEIYKITDNLPWFEKKGICDQLRRAVVSISSNIAEGAAKPSDIDFARFLDQALGSTYEVETQLLISKNVGYIDNTLYLELLNRNTIIEKQIVGLIRSIRTQNR